MNNSDFKKRLDWELEHIVFTAQKRSEVLKRAEEREPSPQRRLHEFLNAEIRIPVRPLVIALLITISGLVYAGIGVTSVSAEEIEKSSITVMESKDGGQADDLYKN
jgi:hypothetical protein